MSWFRLVAVAMLTLPISAQTDWPVFGHDPGGLRYSPLKQINIGNVFRLQRAWTFHSGSPGSEATPLVVGGVMYVTQPNGIYALQPETGKLIWKFGATKVSLRGLSYWPGDKMTHPRVFAGVGSHMVAIDVTMGKPAPGFGNEGFADLKQGVMGDFPNARMAMQSPPAIYKDIVITGSNNNELAPSLGAYGDIRGWDARTGRLLWAFHTVPRQGESGNQTWADESWKDRSGTNAWGFMTVDVKHGLVFVPLGAPTSDFYGADRHGDGLYGNSLVALDAATGKLRWYRQLVHHDLWDYDLAAAPALIEVSRNGKKIPAVAQITKMGMLFIFDRLTGTPLFGMEERPVPQSIVPGEQTSPTQPFPLKPPPLARNSFQKTDIYNLTADQAAFCNDLWNRNHMFTEGPFTPMPVSGNALTYPSTIGGGNWDGLSVDPALGYVFTNIMNLAQWGHMEKREDPKTGEVTYWRTSEMGTYARFWNPKTHIPCQNPPFGELVAVNINTGDIAWRVPLGTVKDLEAQGVKNTGTVNLGGSIATAGGLIFIGATNDSSFRAFDSTTGKQLWVQRIDADGHSVPITYLGKNGKQYVAIMAGGNGYFGNPPSDSLIAFTLSRGPLRQQVQEVETGENTAPVQAEGASRTAREMQLGSSKLPDGKGKAIVQRMCGTCHPIDIVTSERHDRAAWSSVVQTMVARGATGTSGQIQQVIDYLTTHFGA
jgi:glucose dehydrogenase/cytochrome c5